MDRMYQIPKILPLVYCLTLSLTIFNSGCSNKDKNLIGKDTFAKIMADMLVIENLNVMENEKSVLIQKVLSKYQTDQKAFERTREYYKRDPQFWIKVYTSVKDRISAQADSISKSTNPRPHQDN